MREIQDMTLNVSRGLERLERRLLERALHERNLTPLFTMLAIIGKRIFLDFRRPATGHANLVSGVGSAEMDRSSG